MMTSKQKFNNLASVRVQPCISNSMHLRCIPEALLCTLMHCVLDSACYATLHHPLHPHLRTCHPHLFVCLFVCLPLSLAHVLLVLLFCFPFQIGSINLSSLDHS